MYFLALFAEGGDDKPVANDTPTATSTPHPDLGFLSVPNLKKDSVAGAGQA